MLADVVQDLAALDVAVLSDAERVDLLRSLEELKAAAAACQARATVAFDASQRSAEAARGVPAARQGAGVAAQVGLALRCSPARARRFVGVAKALREMPAVMAALTAGRTTEYRAFLAVRETSHLALEHRAEVDRELGARGGGLEQLGDLGVEREARRVADRLDPAGRVRRNSRAVAQRRVSVRPAPDGMCRLSAVLSVAEGVGCYAALLRAADTARATPTPVGTPESRSRGQLMADELVARVTGRSPGVPASVAVSLVMTDVALFGTDDGPAARQQPPQSCQEPATVSGYGPVPADLARALVREADRVWLRRLFTHPVTGDLVAMESRRRVFTGSLRRFVVLRDQVCRTPWCDAAIRHVDHVVPASVGGSTTVANGQGLCEACNYAKTSGGLDQRPDASGSVTTTTGTGHRYRSRPPHPPGSRGSPLRLDYSHAELMVIDLVLGA